MDSRLVGEIIAGSAVALFGGLLTVLGAYLMYRLSNGATVREDDRMFRREEDIRRLAAIETKLDGVAGDVTDCRERMAGIEGMLGYAFPTAVQGRRKP